MKKASQSTPVKSKMTVAQLQKKIAKQEEIKSLKASLDEKDHQIYTIEKKIATNEGRLTFSESLQFVRERVTDELQQQLTELQQYTRRYSVVISGIKKDKNEKTEVENLIQKAESSVNDIDKFHRVGPIKDNNEQDIIVRFKSHTAKEQFYFKRKTLSNTIRVKPSLTSGRRKLLEEAKEHLTDTNYADDMRFFPEFVYADVHGNLKVAFKLKNDENKKVFRKFTTMKELITIINNKNFKKNDDRYAEFEEDEASKISGTQN